MYWPIRHGFSACVLCSGKHCDVCIICLVSLDRWKPTYLDLKEFVREPDLVSTTYLGRQFERTDLHLVSGSRHLGFKHNKTWYARLWMVDCKIDMTAFAVSYGISFSNNKQTNKQAKTFNFNLIYLIIIWGFSFSQCICLYFYRSNRK